MNDLNPKSAAAISFVGWQSVSAAATAAPLAPAAADRPTPKSSKARYQANSPEVQTFYRVNRYPTK